MGGVNLEKRDKSCKFEEPENSYKTGLHTGKIMPVLMAGCSSGKGKKRI